MKKIILTAIAIIALASTSLVTASARECFIVQTCPPPSYVCSPPVYCPPPAPPCAYTYAYCPPPRVIVIHNWSPARYCGPTVVYSSPQVVRYASRRGCW